MTYKSLISFCLLILAGVLFYKGLVIAPEWAVHMAQAWSLYALSRIVATLPKPSTNEEEK